MTYGQSSGTRVYNPFGSDLAQDAFERCGIYAPDGKHMQSCRRSLNLLMASDWSNRGPNLFEFYELVTPLIQGVIQYNLTRDVAAVYDCYRRQYSMNAPASYAVSFSTVINTVQVTINFGESVFDIFSGAILGNSILANPGIQGGPSNSSPVGAYINIVIPVSVGGIVLYGFYVVTSVPTTNSITINAVSAATSTITNGGAVPIFATTAGSATVQVTLANHGLSPGQPFNVAVATLVGGITIFGSYTVQAATTNAFTILVTPNAASSTSAYENAGNAFIAVQNQQAGYTDILMTQLSRYDYAAQADKTAPGAPTTLWVNRQIVPQVNVWPVTDNTGPYELHMWVMKQVQDMNPAGGQTFDLPPRFYYALVTDLARDLAIKFAPDKYAMLKAEADAAWSRAEGSDVEPTSTFIFGLLPNGLN